MSFVICRFPINSSSQLTNLFFTSFKTTMITRVDNKLFRGPKPWPWDIYKLKKLGVTEIYDLMNRQRLGEKYICNLFGIKYINIPTSITDYKFIEKEHIQKITDGIMKNPNKSYIHCSRGRHRTGIAVAGYDMIANKKPFLEVLNKDIFEGGYYSLEDNIAKYQGKPPKRKLKIYQMISKQLSLFIEQFKPKKVATP